MYKLNQLGVFIIWQSGERYAQDIIEEIQCKFNFVSTKTFQWCKGEVGKNLNKLYPHREFDYKSAKVKEIGADEDGARLHFIVVSDSHPNIQNNINLNLKTIKEKYRKEYKTNFLHASDSQEEAFDNIQKVLAYDESKMNSLISTPSDKFVLFNYYEKKLMSSKKNTFDSVENVFIKLEEESLLWVVLRNWDELYNDIVTLAHGDVDILVDDFYKTILALNAERGTKVSYRVQYRVIINKRNIPFDIRHIGDNYYDNSWEETILNTREKLDYFYIPDKCNYYFSLLYHALIHKPRLSNEYSNRLAKLKKDAPSLKNLNNFLIKNNYKIIRPIDKSVYYRYSLRHYTHIVKQFIKKFIFLR
jgi:hypothetical protein